MKQDYTHITVILARTGSMESIREILLEASLLGQAESRTQRSDLNAGPV